MEIRGQADSRSELLERTATQEMQEQVVMYPYSGQFGYMFRVTGISGGIPGLTRSGNLGSLPHTSTLLGGIPSSPFASWSAVATRESSLSSDSPPGKLTGKDGDITSWQPYIQTYMQVA